MHYKPGRHHLPDTKPTSTYFPPPENYNIFIISLSVYELLLQQHDQTEPQLQWGMPRNESEMNIPPFWGWVGEERPGPGAQHCLSLPSWPLCHFMSLGLKYLTWKGKGWGESYPVGWFTHTGFNWGCLSEQHCGVYLDRGPALWRGYSVTRGSVNSNRWCIYTVSTICCQVVNGTCCKVNEVGWVPLGCCAPFLGRVAQGGLTEAAEAMGIAEISSKSKSLGLIRWKATGAQPLQHWLQSISK